MCDKINQGPIISFSGRPWPKGMPMWQFQQNPHHWGQISDQYFGKDFGGIKDSKQKRVYWYVFSHFFRHTPNFWGIKPLYCHFWKFFSLELMKDINRNLFMPLSTNSNAFQSPKKLVSKFDDFDCLQLYPAKMMTVKPIYAHHLMEPEGLCLYV